MPHIINPAELSLDQIEEIEKQCLRALYQAAVDFGTEPFSIFRLSKDEAGNIAEDITREFMDRLGCYQIGQRLFGKVDYRKARYIILPDLSVRQALFLDSKAIKSEKDARLQMTQLSMEVRFEGQKGKIVHQHGSLPKVMQAGGLDYLVTTQLAHYFYEDNANGEHILKGLQLAAIPNGLLQDRYNPTPQDGIWKAGPHAESLGEAFRTRISFNALAAKARWRVQSIRYVDDGAGISHEWLEGEG